MTEPQTYVITADIKTAIQGHEERILDALGIKWNGRGTHVDCVYPEHGGANDWRWDAKATKAYCTCSPKGDNVIEVLRKCEGLDFDAAKIRTAELIGRSDLIKTKGSGKGGQRTDPVSLLAVPAELEDANLVRAYLGFRLGVDPQDLLMPRTRVVGWSAFPYVDPPPKGSKAFVEVARPPCAVFETVAADGRRHAHRIYTAIEGLGKADLGKTSDGHSRDPKKSASAAKEGLSTAGCSTLWGDVTKAEHVIIGEGIETCAAVAHAFRQEVEAGEIVVAAAITAGGVTAFQPYPATKQVTVAADRDEKRKPSKPEPTKAGERAAREFGLRRHDEGSTINVRIALPGRPGEGIDWLDVLRAEGVEAVRSGIEAAARFVPTAAELQGWAEKTGREAELERVAAMYPLPRLNGRDLFYKHTKNGQPWVHKTIMKGKGEDATPVDIAIASPFGVRARLRMIDAEDDYGLRLVVRDPTGHPRAIDIDNGDLAAMGGVEVRKLFLRAGVRFEDDGEMVAVASLKAADPINEISIVRHPGWHRIADAAVYVAPGGEIFGLPKGKNVELSAGVVLVGAVARAGTLDGWKAAATAAMMAPRCPHFSLGLASGFAGILVDLCGMDSCGINFSGLTSAGKTTAQRLAASAWSVPDSTRPGLFQVAKTTVNGLEYLARKANGTVFALDELAHLSGKETGAVVYTLASGIGKTRMTAAATAREPHRWKTFAVLSGETSLEAKIRADGGTWTGGQAVRVADVDVSNINRLVDSTTFGKINGVLRNYGHAGPAFARALIDAGTHERASEVKEGIHEMARRLAGPGADAARIRSALPLAILAMAGGMAQTYGLLPAGPMLRDAIRWAWTGFQESSDAIALDPAEQAIGNIRTWVAEKWRTSLHGVHAEERPTRDAVGWWDENAVYLTPERLVEAAGGTLKEGMISRALNAAGMLAKRKSDENLAIFWVPRIGKLKTYALSRAHFGRETTDDGTFKLHAGGRT